MKVTVCEMSDNEDSFIVDWNALTIHLDQNRSDLLLLPEMPFSKWIPSEKKADRETKLQSAEKHKQWMSKIEHLNVNYIAYSRPIIAGDKFFNTAFVYEKGVGHHKIYTKSFFPEEPSGSGHSKTGRAGVWRRRDETISHPWGESRWRRAACPDFATLDLRCK